MLTLAASWSPSCQKLRSINWSDAKLEKHLENADLWQAKSMVSTQKNLVCVHVGRAGGSAFSAIVQRLHNLAGCFLLKPPWPLAFGWSCFLAHYQYILKILLKVFQNLSSYFAKKQIIKQRQSRNVLGRGSKFPTRLDQRPNRTGWSAVPLTAASSVSCYCWFMDLFLALTNCAVPRWSSWSNTSASLCESGALPYVEALSFSACALSTRRISQIRALWFLFSVALLGLITLPNGSVIADHGEASSTAEHILRNKKCAAICRSKWSCVAGQTSTTEMS